MVRRAGTAAQNWGEAPAPQAQCATPLGLSLSEGLGGAKLRGEAEHHGLNAKTRVPSEPGCQPRSR
jgi:hypothetical protein